MTKKPRQRSNKFRKHSWKVIGRAEKVVEKGDEVFSYVFRIRTAKEIRIDKLADKELDFVEIVRRAFWQQVGETFSTSIPQQLSVYIVEACGMTIIGGHALVMLHVTFFAIGIINRTLAVYGQIEADEKAEMKRQEEENRRLAKFLLPCIQPNLSS